MSKRSATSTPQPEAKRAARMRQVLAKAIAASLDSFGEEEMRGCFQKLLKERPELEAGLLEWRSKLLARVQGGLERRFAAVCAERGVGAKLLLLEQLMRDADGDPDLAAERVVEPLPDGVRARDALRALRVAAKEREKARLVAAAEAQERENDALEREARAHAAQTDIGRHPAVATLRDAVKQAHASSVGGEPEG